MPEELKPELCSFAVQMKDSWKPSVCIRLTTPCACFILVSPCVYILTQNGSIPRYRSKKKSITIYLRQHMQMKKWRLDFGQAKGHLIFLVGSLFKCEQVQNIWNNESGCKRMWGFFFGPNGLVWRMVIWFVRYQLRSHGSRGPIPRDKSRFRSIHWSSGRQFFHLWIMIEYSLSSQSHFDISLHFWLA